MDFSNPVPVLVVAIVVLALVWRAGGVRKALGASQKAVKSVVAPTDPSQLDSQALGVLLAQAARREAELELARQVSDATVSKIKAAYQAPFSVTSPERPTPPPGSGGSAAQ